MAQKRISSLRLLVIETDWQTGELSSRDIINSFTAKDCILKKFEKIKLFYSRISKFKMVFIHVLNLFNFTMDLDSFIYNPAF